MAILGAKEVQQAMLDSKPKTQGGRLLREWRADQDVSQEHVAARVGVSGAAICRWETSERIPPLDIALAIRKVTGGIVTVEAWNEKIPAEGADAPTPDVQAPAA